MSTFQTLLKAHLTSTVNLQVKRQELVEMVQTQAIEHGDFDYAAVLLNGLWSVKAYGASKTICDYLKAHGPYEISHAKGEAAPFKAKATPKDADGNRAPFKDMVVPYNEWEKAAVVAALTADSLFARITSAIKASADLGDDELIKFDAMVSSLATNSGSTEAMAA